MRDTILKCVQLQGNMDEDWYVQFERFRKQANDHAIYLDIHRVSYIQSLIVMVPA